MPRRRLLATPLAAWERDGLKAALLKARLPADDVGDARLLFWRFETEACALNCRAIYLLTAADAKFFGRLGYGPCARGDVPEAIRGSRQFAELCAPTAAAMVKRIG